MYVNSVWLLLHDTNNVVMLNSTSIHSVQNINILIIKVNKSKAFSYIYNKANAK